jgi:hypothetical protein
MSEPFVGTARNREVPNGSPEKSFPFRVRVANLGKSAAWRVSVLLTLLEKYNEEARRYEVEEWFVPVELATSRIDARQSDHVLTQGQYQLRIQVTGCERRPRRCPRAARLLRERSGSHL